MSKILLYTFVVTLLLGQFSSIFKNSGVNLYLFDVVSIVFNIVFIYESLLSKKNINITKFHLLLFAFTAIGLGSLLINTTIFNISLVSSLGYLIRFLSYLINSIAIYNMVLTKRISKEWFINVCIDGGLFLVIAGFFQLIFLPDFEVLDPALGWDPHKNRLASTFFDPNFLGSYLVLCFVLLLNSFTEKTQSNRNNTRDIVRATLLVAGIFLAFSRSAWLMLAIVFIGYGLFKNLKYLVVGFLLMFLAYYTVPRVQTRISGTTDPADSAQFRYSSWQGSLKLFKLSPYIGIGYNATRDVSKEIGLITVDDLQKHHVSGSDSSLLFILTTTGILGFITFTLAIVSVYVQSGAQKLFYGTTIVALIANSQFINSLFYPQIMIVWMVLSSFSFLSYKKP